MHRPKALRRLVGSSTLLAVVATGLGCLAMYGSARVITYVLTTGDRQAESQAARYVRHEFKSVQKDLSAASATGDQARVEAAMTRLSGPSQVRRTVYRDQTSDPDHVIAMVMLDTSRSYGCIGGVCNTHVRGCAMLSIKVGEEPKWKDWSCPPSGAGKTINVLAG